MSFLLQEPARRKKNQNGGGSRFSVRSHSNDNIAIGDNGRMVRGLESTGFNRGKRKNSQQQVSGNQIMLQRQQRKTATTKLQKHQHQQQMKQRQQNENQCIEQEQENLGDYTMERGKLWNNVMTVSLLLVILDKIHFTRFSPFNFVLAKTHHFLRWTRSNGRSSNS